MNFDSRINEQGLLIVEESPLQTSRIVKILDRIGVRNIITSSDGHQGLDMARSLNPAILLLSLELPGIDGIEILQHMFEENLRPALILTGDSDNVLSGSFAAMAEAWGFQMLGVFNKPITDSHLQSALLKYTHLPLHLVSQRYPRWTNQGN